MTHLRITDPPPTSTYLEDMLRFLALGVTMVVLFVLLMFLMEGDSNRQGHLLCLAHRDDPAVHSECVKLGWATERGAE